MTVEPPIRVAVVGLGPIGLSVYRTLAERSWVRVVGAVDVDPDLVGGDAGELAGIGNRGLSVVPSLDDLEEAGEVAVFCAGSRLVAAAPLIFSAVDAGWHVLSTCEELSYPWLRYPVVAAEIDGRARTAGRTVLGTGINPGWAMDAAALFLSGVVERVDAVEVVRVVDATRRRSQLQSKVGVGLSVAEFERRVGEGTIGHVGLAESAALLAAAFSWPGDEVAESLQPVLVAGSVAGITQTATVDHEGRRRVSLRLDMYAGAPDPHDAIALTGSSIITQRIDGIHGDTATAAIVVNALPAMRLLPAGLATVLDVVSVRSRPVGRTPPPVSTTIAE